MKRSRTGLGLVFLFVGGLVASCGTESQSELPWIQGGDRSSFPALLLNVEGDEAQLSDDLRAGLLWEQAPMFWGSPLDAVPSILSIDLLGGVPPEAAIPSDPDFRYAVAKIVVINSSVAADAPDYWMSETDGYSLWWLPEPIENYEGRFNLGAGWHLMRHVITDIQCESMDGPLLSYDVEPVSPATMVRLELGTTLQDTAHRACP